MKKNEKMILPAEAVAIIDSYGKTVGVEELPLLESRERILAEDIFSEIEMPPFNKSAMDGYAVASDDNSEKFKIVETIPAGKFPEKTIKKGQCSRIMTGAPLPDGAARVIKVEVTEEENGFMYLTGEDNAGNVCLRGEDIKIGDRVLKKGRTMRTAEIGAAASLGHKMIKVFKKVKTGLITTGSEIRDPGEVLGPGQIYNSNGYSLSVQLLNAGADIIERKIVRDKDTELSFELEKLLDNAELILISGGVSMGEFDLVPDILKELGVTIHFNKVAVQPGKPTLFGTRGDKIVFGLPGNPVSTFVIFELFVKPLLMRISGSSYEAQTMRGKLDKGFKRRKTERELHIPVSYSNGIIKLIEYHGSAHFVSLLGANALLKIERGVSEIAPGEIVDVRQI